MLKKHPLLFLFLGGCSAGIAALFTMQYGVASLLSFLVGCSISIVTLYIWTTVKKHRLLFSSLGVCGAAIVAWFSGQYGIASYSSFFGGYIASIIVASFTIGRQEAVRRLWNVISEPYQARRFWKWISEPTRAGGIQAAAAIVSVVIVGWGIVTYLATQSQNQNQSRLQAHLSAWQVIDLAEGQSGSGGRIDALEALNNDNVSLAGVTATKANLQGINLPHANLNEAHLHGDLLIEAHLEGAQLNFADLILQR